MLSRMVGGLDDLRGIRWVRALLDPPESFSESLVGKVLSCLVISCLIAVATPWLADRFKEGLDSAVQGALVQALTLDQTCTSTPEKPCVVVVAIDDVEFREVFKQQSPLDPDELRALIDVLAKAGPLAVAIDLDMAPASDAKPEIGAREALRSSIETLGRATQGRTVMVCPQSYSTTQPSALDRLWVSSFGPEVKFANADLASDGLYVNRKMRPLGIAVAHAVEKKPSQSAELSGGSLAPSSEMAHETCSKSKPGFAQASERTLIVPSSLPVYAFKTAIESPQLLKNKIVVVGGAYGTSDRFYFRGVEQPVYGVMLHAWTAHNELESAAEFPESANLLLDICIGMLTGSLFGLIWTQIAKYRKRFAWRALYYAAFFGLAVLAPAVLVYSAAQLAQFGVFMGAAAMIVSVLFDSVLSSHERLLAPHDPHDGGLGRSYWWWLSAALCFSLGFSGVWILFNAGHFVWLPVLVGVAAAGLLKLPGLLIPTPPGQLQRGEPNFKSDCAQVLVGNSRAGPPRGASKHKPPELPPVIDDVAKLGWLFLRAWVVSYTLLHDAHAWPAASMAAAFFLASWIFDRAPLFRQAVSSR